MNFDRRSINKRFESMKDEAVKSWRPAWKEIRDYIAPTHGFFDEQPNWGKKIDHETIVNGHGMYAADILAAGMQSGMTSPSRPWFALRTPDPDLMEFQPVKEWLRRLETDMYSVFAKSNLYQALHTLYAEIGPFGTGAMMMLRDYDTVIRATNFTIGEYYLGIDKVGRVASFARQFYYTVGQMVEEYGLDNCSDTVKNMYLKNQVDQYRLLRHLIEPNDKRIEGRSDFSGKRWRSVTWEADGRNDVALRVAGFNSFPVMAPRWQIRSSSDVYGRGPGWKALGDVKMLQKLEADGLIALDKVVDPPVQVMGEVDHVNLFPGGVTYSSQVLPNAGVRPAYQVAPDFASVQDWVTKVEQRIDKDFYVDLFRMISDIERSNVTAEEIAEKKQEKLQALGPVLETLQAELWSPVIDRAFDIMMESGLVPPPPMELQGQDLKIEYISILAQAQKMVGTAAIEQTFRFAGSLIQAFPESADNLDADEAVRKYADKTGASPEIVRSMDKVQKIRTARQQQVQAEQQAQAAERMAQGAKTLSETPVGENSALDAVMAGLGGSGIPVGQ